MCSNESIYAFLVIFNRIMSIIQVVAPILVLLMLSIAFFRLVVDPDDKKIKKSIKNMFISLLVVFFIPMLVRTTIYLVSNNSSCLEEEDIVYLNEGYKFFQNVEYIELDNGKSRSSVIPNPRDYEAGDEKEEVISPANDVMKISNSNAVYFLNTGRSSDSFIIQDGEHFGLIDTSVPSKGSFIVTQLKKLGVKQLDFIIITHSHDDHVGGFSKVIDSIPVKALFVKTEGTRYPAHQGTYSSLIKKAKKKGTYVCNVADSKCQSFSLGNINFRLYNTNFFSAALVSRNNYGRFDNVNSVCAVANINGKRVYFSGDIGNYFGQNQETITARQIGDIDVYKVAHHGYVSFNNHQEAINYLKPEYSVVTNDRGTASTAINRVKKSNSKYVRTYYTPEGSVTMMIEPSGNIKFYQ